MQNLDFSGFNVPMYAEPVVESVSKVSNNALVERDLSHFEDWNDKKVQDLTLEQLCMTSRENNDGAPNNGIRHYVLIQKVLDMCSERGLHGEVRDLFACKQGGGQYPGVSVVDNIAKSLPEAPEMQQRNVKATIVRRIFCNSLSKILMRQTANTPTPSRFLIRREAFRLPLVLTSMLAIINVS